MLLKKLSYLLDLCALATGTILQNGQVRITDYPDTKIDISSYDFRTYDANVTELSYKGRWDSNKVSWWSAPGLVFGFTGSTVAITFGELTTDTTLVGYRIGGMDWTFTNVTAGATHLLVTPSTPGVNETYPVNPLTFELRVTNWAYGVQISKVHVAAGESLIKIPPYKRTIEFIGDSLSAGMYTSYEGLSSFAYGVGAGLGDTEYFITAYPGICVSDQECWGNPRGQVHQWFYTSDTSGRAAEIWGDHPEPWAFEKQETTPDIVVVNLGTNDNNAANNVSTETYVDAYKNLIRGVHGKYPKAQVIVMQLWMGFYPYGNTYQQGLGFEQELKDIVAYFNSNEYLDAPSIWDGATSATTVLDAPSEPFVHYFSTKGISKFSPLPFTISYDIPDTWARSG
ncbi:SGNH hydrolase-type esterase domain-containing protein [Daldinia caldariorum]|uniref:SGNH hydrolase-type esterase domain-containing protein n=1 Tax=Daldinia caldariorum TaxID=326644 RepID=UPI002007DD74|nr:SGNH hydrolase-type esterase domain-containing protein [Daldinia caldariorum]KAI1472530.1 SGNH hydrolase-type esterase domain-containing protein [Daldinia caldariorum]